MAQDAWDPQQYEKFKAQRSEPFFDLMHMLEKSESPRVVDLGCGTGELTAELHRYLNAKSTLGIDSSSEMLTKASALNVSGLKFEKASIENWRHPEAVDILFSNAALQWCSDHRTIFANLTQSLQLGGQLAVQMPMNHDYPTHVLAETMSRESKWSHLLGYTSRNAESTMLKPEEYATLLFQLGYREQKVFLRVYGHELPSRDHVIDWVKGTLLTYFKSRLSPADYDEFVNEYRTRLFKILPNEAPFFYPFKRLLLWARR